MAMSKYPDEIGNTPVIAVEESEIVFDGQTWVTLVPANDDDNRIWEYCIETHEIVQTA